MSRVTFVNIPAHGHTNPTLPLTAELIRRGEEISYYSVREFAPAIEKTGAIFCDYPFADQFDHTRPDTNPVRMATLLIKATEILIPQMLPAIQAQKPDYIIHDSLATWGRAIARILGIPAICSTTTFAMSNRTTPINYLPHFLGMFVRALPQFIEFQQIATRLSRAYHIPRLTQMEMFTNPSELTLVYTSEKFQPGANRFSSNYRFVGPSLDAEQMELPLPFDLPSDKPILYISLGTLFNENVAFYRLCFEAFALMNFHVVLSIGNKIAIDSLGEIPANFTVQNRVPQLALLKRVSAFITHGGMNSVHEALYHHVPLVVVPQAADQLFVAERVAQVGAGVRLDNHQLTIERLRSRVREVLDRPNYRQSAAVIGESLKTAGGTRRSADEIFAFKESRAMRSR